jgi:hypothetical protein
MIRHGLLSPNLKLLPDVVSHCDPDGWEAREFCFEWCVSSLFPYLFRFSCTDALLSLPPPSFPASVMAKSTLVKDERDTPMR